MKHKKWLALLFLLFSPLGLAAHTLLILPNAGMKPFLSAIQHAQRHVVLTIYGIDNQILIDSLIAAQQRGARVEVTLQKQPYRAHHENDHAISTLLRGGVKVYFSQPRFENMHQKTLTIDDNVSYIMTFNFVYSAFKDERNFAVMTTDPAEIAQILLVYRADQSNTRLSLPSLPASDLVWSPENSRSVLSHLISSAKQSILVDAPELTDYAMIGLLARAAQHHVRVQVISNAREVRKSAAKFHYLMARGVEIHLASPPFMHAKMIMVDNTLAYVGSANLSFAGLEKNRELGILCRSREVLSAVTQTFQEDWQRTTAFE